ncbi:MAG: 23S rRNA (guanosine(2251)-2'-O)-methyltransferase RlmB [Acidimicrobiia bacterium]|nr:23S rRNA (guanosine(2251)-2'-O)-methyltransferase RlmB [Acidimicrobiia bacterium]
MAPAGIGDSVEGVHAVRAAVEAGRVERLFVDRRRRDDLEGMVGSSGVPYEVVDDIRVHALTEVPQGFVAKCRPLATVSVEDAIELATPAALMVLDHVEDPHNLGAVARSAHAAGVQALITGGRRSAPFGPAAFKAAAGALEHVRVCVVSSIADTITRLKKTGVWTVGLTAGASQSLFGLPLLTEPVAIIAGAEGRGLSRLVEDRVDVVASIPMRSDLESLNVSVAAALAMFEIGRVRGELG